MISPTLRTLFLATALLTLASAAPWSNAFRKPAAAAASPSAYTPTPPADDSPVVDDRRASDASYTPTPPADDAPVQGDRYEPTPPADDAPVEGDRRVEFGPERDDYKGEEGLLRAAAELLQVDERLNSDKGDVVFRRKMAGMPMPHDDHTVVMA
eukprot:CAMPEP_0174890514 /NCGR_PEP_ID=MMETSP0167-20121228/5663_1 /TAXON_ID=38298 /ORGANISM="Rhodella maculata, Strain CCMP736" /LENGTH=153 /DNA_ID=CAMNT_0016128345 /DNA_START=31 /DNA_END=492 /DNA_ORIENTATION=-